MNWVNITSTFHILCLITTASLLSYCSWRYVQNESSSLIDFRAYHRSEKDIYPSLSLCFVGNGIYNKSKLRQKYGIQAFRDYTSFLVGDTWNDTMKNINYDDVTMSLRSYVNSISLQINNYVSGPVYKWPDNDIKKPMSGNKNVLSSSSEETFPFFVSFRQARIKCFSIDFSEETMTRIKGRIITSLLVTFRNLSSLNVPLTDSGSLNVQLFYSMHYPKQLIRTHPFHVEMIPNTGLVSGYLKKKTFLIDNINVIRRRSTSTKPCHNAWKKDDDFIRRKILKRSKCKPPYWIDSDYPICHDQESMKIANIDTEDIGNPEFLKHFVEPCDQIKTIAFNCQEDLHINESNGETSALLLAFMNSQYKEIRHIRALDVESLVGVMGGYVGLFLGFAIWQLPDAIKFVFDKFLPFVRS